MKCLTTGVILLSPVSLCCNFFKEIKLMIKGFQHLIAISKYGILSEKDLHYPIVYPRIENSVTLLGGRFGISRRMFLSGETMRKMLGKNKE